MKYTILNDCRILDLTDHKGLIAGRILADLGAEVIQIEPPEGHPARYAPPLDPGGTSYYWQAYTSGKRSVTINWSNESDLRKFNEMVAAADIVIDSGDSAAASFQRYKDLTAINPRLIYVAISSFGLTGPKAEYEATDLIVWAAGGPMFGAQEEGLPPVRVSVPQAYLHAGADAAVGALIALETRDACGKGQLVEISAQKSVAQATLSAVLSESVRDYLFQEELEATNAKGGIDKLDLSGSGSATRRRKTWKTRNGTVELHLAMGPSSGRFTNNLFRWMLETGHLPAAYRHWDWSTIHEKIASGSVTQADIEDVRNLVASFLEKYSQEELIEAAIAKKLLIAPRYEVSDVVSSPQVIHRGTIATKTDKRGKTHRLVRAPMRVSGEKTRFNNGPPDIGEANNGPILKKRGSFPLPPAPGLQPQDSAFQGLKVLDLSWVVAGPFVGRTLADFGATVVRVESSRKVDTARGIAPFLDGKRGRDSSAVYHNCNAGKFGLSLDLTNKQSQPVLDDLVRWADVIIESFSPGTLKKFNLAYNRIKELNPRAILLSSSLMGQSGPYSGLAGFGNLGSCLSGIQCLVGWPGRPPRGPFGPYTDYLGPRFSLVALISALRRRRKTGRGSWIDVSQVECGMYFIAPAILEYLETGRSMSACGNDDPLMSPHGVYRTLERGPRKSAFIALAVPDDATWRRLVKLMNAHDRLGDGKFGDSKGRRDHKELIDKEIQEWTSNFSADELETLLQTNAIPAHIVSSAADFALDLQLIHDRHIKELLHPSLGPFPLEGSRIILSETPAVTERLAPMLGEHNDLILRSFLGYSDSQIESIANSNILI